MFIEIIAALVFAKLKKYKLKFLFKTWTIVPILISELALIFLQITIFAGNYYFVQYTEIVRIAHTACYLIPMFAFSLYKPAVIGSASMMVGTLLNKFVIAQNNGKMPVFPSLSYWTGYVKPDVFDRVNDIHILGDVNTKWKILTDYIDVGYCILSPGDVFIHLFTLFMLYSMIKAVNLKYDPKLQNKNLHK